MWKKRKILAQIEKVKNFGKSFDFFALIPP